MKTPVNFRDLGGYTGFEGKTVKPGKILRGGQFFELSQQEKEAFCEEYDICTIIDLRNGDSCIQEPNGEIPGVKQVVFEVMKNMLELDKSHPMRDSNATAAGNFLKEFYGGFIHNEHAGNCFRDILQLFADTEDGALYFHCFAGKDRTGILAVLVLTVLGVSGEDIIYDYLRSIELRKEDNERLLKIAREQGKTEDELGAFATFLTVDRAYIENFMRSADEKYGSVEGYIREGLGISEDVFTCMRELYLV